MDATLPALKSYITLKLAINMKLSLLLLLLGPVSIIFADTSTPLHNAYAQDDLDMRNHAIINLQSINGIPISSFNTGGGGGGGGSGVSSFSFINLGGLTFTLPSTIGDIAFSAGIGTPSSLSVSSSNSVSGTTHSHAVASSADPGSAASILASDSNGDLALVDLKSHGATFNLANSTATTINTAGATNARFVLGNTSRLQSANYASQTTGYGITGDGSADFRYIYTDELHAKAFIADLEEALAGGQIISKSVGKIQSAFTVPASSASASLSVEDFAGFPSFHVFVNGDLVRVRQFNRNAGTGSLDISDAWGTVTYVSHTNGAGTNPGYQTYTFTRVAGGNATTGSSVPAGGLALDYGTSANKFGYYEVSAADGINASNSPYSQVVTSATSPATDRAVRTRLGNLKGISNVTEFGLYAGNVADGSTLGTANRYLRISDTNFEINNLDLNVYSSGTKTIALNAATPYLAIGSPVPTSYLGASGIWMGNSSGTYKFHLGSVSAGALTQGISFDGTNLNVKGAITITGGNAAKTDLSNVTGNYAGAGAPGGPATSIVGQGSLATANNVGWTTQVTGRPVELTDGRIATALNSAGTVVTRVVPSSVAAPGASGLYLGSDRMGFYSGSAWKTYMDNGGGFYLTGSGSNALTWDGAALSVNGAINASSGSFTGSVSVGSGSLIGGGGNTIIDSTGLHLATSGATGPFATAGTAVSWTANSGEISTVGSTHSLKLAGRDASALGNGLSSAELMALESGESAVTGTGAGLHFSVKNDINVASAAYANLWSNSSQPFAGLYIGGSGVPVATLQVAGTGLFSNTISIPNGRFYNWNLTGGGASSFTYTASQYAGGIFLSGFNGRIGFFTTPSGTAGATVTPTEQASITQTGVFLTAGGFRPPHMADGSAENDTIYYSTTASKLVYKDSGGTVNPLY
jgi:hypothetical protein